MKYTITAFAFLLTCSISMSQNTIFLEDFETSPVTSIVNTFGGDVPDGPSPCGKASRGTTADFNSASVDFVNAENDTYFLGVNPEDPCGGFYEAELEATNLDWSATDSLVFSFRYFKGTGLNWGASVLEITFDDGTNTHTVSAALSTEDSWTDYSETLPSSFYGASSVDITIDMGGGEGVGIDDFEIVNYKPEISATPSTLTTFNYTEGNGPSGEQTLDVSGVFLKDDVSITAPSGFEISEMSGGGFTGSISLSPTAGEVPNTNIYVRFAAGFPAVGSPYFGDLIISSQDADPIVIPLEGVVEESSASVEEYAEKNVRVYPNPFENEVHIDIPHQDEVEVQLINNRGQVMRRSAHAMSDHLSLKYDVQPGLYFLKVSYGHQQITLKMVKN